MSAAAAAAAAPLSSDADAAPAPAPAPASEETSAEAKTSETPAPPKHTKQEDNAGGSDKAEDEARRKRAARQKHEDDLSLKVKPRYVLEERSPVLAAPVDDRDRPRPQADDGGGATKKLTKSERRKRNRGQNKKRPRDARTPDSAKLCRAVARGETCPYGDDGPKPCKFSHDVKSFLADRPPDIAEVVGGCPNYNLDGECEFGLMCRVGGNHLNLATGENLTKDVDTEGGDKSKKKEERGLNVLKKDVQTQLRKNTYPFVCKRYFEGKKHGRGKRWDGEKKEVKDEDKSMSKGDEATKEGADGKASDEAVAIKKEKEPTEAAEAEAKTVDLSPLPSKTRPIIDFRNKVYVAPLTTVGNLPFRRIMKRFGADITCGEMALATGLLAGRASEWSLVRRHPCEDVFGIQIAAGHPDQFTRCCEVLEAECSMDFVDLNLGCPIDLVCDKGAGAALMLRERKLKDCLMGISKTLSCPFTMKIRTGWDEGRPIAHNLVPKVQGWEIPGLSTVMLHGRSRLQRYTKLADWDYISKVAASQSDGHPRLPLIGNGDIFSYTDYEAKIERSSSAEGGEGIQPTAMLARGALIKPWLPTEIKERRHWDISASERLDVLRDFVRYGLEHWGTDQQGVNNTRRFLLEWLSFLYRYVPVGLLEVVPQQMNQRPPRHMCGRSDLETLMMSRNSADWVKISEMLLGPVPDGFRFEPKHKANSYKASN